MSTEVLREQGNIDIPSATTFDSLARALRSNITAVLL